MNNVEREVEIQQADHHNRNNVVVWCCCFLPQDSTWISSPDGRLTFKCWLRTDGRGRLLYSLVRSGDDIILPSGMGLVANVNGNNRTKSWWLCG